MRDMYHQGGHPPEPCGPHPEWTEYPHPGHPPVSYYMTAYDIAMKHGYTGTEEEWLASLKGEPGLSAFELYVKNTGYTGTEAEWNTMVNAAKTEAVAAKDTAVSAKNDAVAAKEAAVAAKEATLAVGITDYKTVRGQVQAITRKMAAVTNGLINAIPKGGVFQTFKRMNAGEHPDMNDREMFWKDEHFWDFDLNFAPANTPVKCTVDNVEYDLPGQMIVLKGGLSDAAMWWFPIDFIADNTLHGASTNMGWQIWRRKQNYYDDDYQLSAWECVNGIDPDECIWISKEV